VREGGRWRALARACRARTDVRAANMYTRKQTCSQPIPHVMQPQTNRCGAMTSFSACSRTCRAVDTGGAQARHRSWRALVVSLAGRLFVLC
jgi:hypothetical protein